MRYLGSILSVGSGLFIMLFWTTWNYENTTRSEHSVETGTHHHNLALTLIHTLTPPTSVPPCSLLMRAAQT